MPECLSLQQFHGNEGSPICLVNFIDRADVRVVQRGGGLGFSLKTRQCLRVFGYIVREELEGDKSTELHVLRLINHTHPTTTQLLDDAVVRDGLADQMRGFHPCGQMLGALRRWCQWTYDGLTGSQLPNCRQTIRTSEVVR